jgi:hypothetical protein
VTRHDTHSPWPRRGSGDGTRLRRPRGAGRLCGLSCASGRRRTRGQFTRIRVRLSVKSIREPRNVSDTQEKRDRKETYYETLSGS